VHRSASPAAEARVAATHALGTALGRVRQQQQLSRGHERSGPCANCGAAEPGAKQKSRAKHGGPARPKWVPAPDNVTREGSEVRSLCGACRASWLRHGKGKAEGVGLWEAYARLSDGAWASCLGAPGVPAARTLEAAARLAAAGERVPGRKASVARQAALLAARWEPELRRVWEALPEARSVELPWSCRERRTGAAWLVAVRTAGAEQP
jgi:hypothetical protein